MRKKHGTILIHQHAQRGGASLYSPARPARRHKPALANAAVACACGPSAYLTAPLHPPRTNHAEFQVNGDSRRGLQGTDIGQSPALPRLWAHVWCEWGRPLGDPGAPCWGLLGPSRAPRTTSGLAAERVQFALPRGLRRPKARQQAQLWPV